ncbi:protein COFACTOR ASSEMBLY OF COMPLEX C SUBUNIT B CCB3, chloroplastic [Pistacia vera]|uniref:protein COFACTOR ASSEMBLY OF COMPLEX C SUBUNIT B CCB3, chloroplastic n=1 Tax=Pistacia vera TaxID=55513 RepID=UPI001262FFCF|nr:protein COFACTOR ASSEMBLY OF COMPLEX C SUBUNIT B CCB3, chloroplastic [Pistacia vera]
MATSVYLGSMVHSKGGWPPIPIQHFTLSERFTSSIRRIPSRGHKISLFHSMGAADFLHIEPSPSNAAAISGNSHNVLDFVTDISGGSLSLIEKLALADLEPSTAKLAIGIIGPVLSAFSFLFILRVIMSWYPKLPLGKFPYVLVYAPTEPFLVPTRKLIPPLAGVDITPVVWVGLVNFLSEILVGPQGLLVLVSQQLS